MSEDIKAGSEMTITLSNGATVELTRHTNDTDVMTGDYIIDENDDEANGDSPLSIATYPIGTTVDISGNALASDTTVGDIDDITAHAMIQRRLRHPYLLRVTRILPLMCWLMTV